MNFAYPIQKIQDWFTQQWVIMCGKRIDPDEFQWLIGPFGKLNGIGENFITQLAEQEHLIINRNSKFGGLIPSIEMLNLSEKELSKLSKSIINFYEQTANYDLVFSVKWNPFFKFFGVLVNLLFSNRIHQLNIPTNRIKDSESITSEIITLTEPETKLVKYTIWLRTIQSSGQVIYSGIYGTCILPSGQVCIKAVFPLPNGNATVLMSPSVGVDGELILNSSGKQFGDEGFYFLLNDSNGNYWAKYLSAFRDSLIVYSKDKHLSAEQVLTLWHRRILCFKYQIQKKKF